MVQDLERTDLVGRAMAGDLVAMDPTYQKATGLMLVDTDGVTPPITIETGDLAGDPSWQHGGGARRQ